MKKVAFFAALMVSCSVSVFAGKMELTTYYPAPNGEYNTLQGNKITVGTPASGSSPDVSGGVQFIGGTADPSGHSSGGLYYNATDNMFRYTSDGTNWKNLQSPIGAAYDFAKLEMFTATEDFGWQDVVNITGSGFCSEVRSEGGMRII